MTNPDRKSSDSRAGMTAALRLVAAGYLMYLGYELIRDHLRGVSSLSPALAWLCGIVFLTAGLLFGWYSWQRYRAGRSSGEDISEEDPHEDPSSGS